MKPRALIVAAGVGLLLVGGLLAGVAFRPDEGDKSSGPSPNPETLVSLPPAAQRYVDAVAADDLDGLVAAFAPDALIVDVGREIRGHDAIRHWADTEVIGGRLTVLNNEPDERGTTMLVRFAPSGTGGFEARYVFYIENDHIVRAELTYA
ncbi:MAG: nuclear transport factor 2 family protein [Corynebacteriales bacterium]|nr:nuclear transport factor 2 family protein [Mycobacteriales bacterium]